MLGLPVGWSPETWRRLTFLRSRNLAGAISSKRAVAGGLFPESSNVDDAGSAWSMYTRAILASPASRGPWSLACSNCTAGEASMLKTGVLLSCVIAVLTGQLVRVPPCPLCPISAVTQKIKWTCPFLWRITNTLDTSQGQLQIYLFIYLLVLQSPGGILAGGYKKT